MHTLASCRVSGVNLASSHVSRQYKPRQEDIYPPPHPVVVMQEVYQLPGTSGDRFVSPLIKTPAPITFRYDTEAIIKPTSRLMSPLTDQLLLPFDC